MKKMLFFPIFALMFLSSSITAAPKPEAKFDTQSTSNVLHGVVLDNLTNETLAGAIITANGQKVYTDLDGNFTVSNLCNGKCQLKITLISYEEQTLYVEVNNGQSLNIKLLQR